MSSAYRTASYAPLPWSFQVPNPSRGMTAFEQRLTAGRGAVPLSLSMTLFCP